MRTGHDVMKTLWIKFQTGELIPLEYGDRYKKTFQTFEAFCEQFRSGWTDSKGDPRETRWAVTNSADIEPLMHEWKMPL